MLDMDGASTAPSSVVPRGTEIAVAAQNVHWGSEGAFTGEVSPSMLRELGVYGAIVGHCDWEATNGKWNNAHGVNNCDEQTFKDAKGQGRLYCFAKD